MSEFVKSLKEYMRKRHVSVFFVQSDQWYFIVTDAIESNFISPTLPEKVTDSRKSTSRLFETRKAHSPTFWRILKFMIEWFQWHVKASSVILFLEISSFYVHIYIFVYVFIKIFYTVPSNMYIYIYMHIYLTHRLDDTRVDLGLMAMKIPSTLHRFPELESHHQMQFSAKTRTTFEWYLLSYRAYSQWFLKPTVRAIF